MGFGRGGGGGGGWAYRIVSGQWLNIFLAFLYDVFQESSVLYHKNKT